MERLDFEKSNLAADFGASLTMIRTAVPDAIASAILAGVNPFYGFTAQMVGTPLADDEVLVASANGLANIQSVDAFGSAEAA